MATKIYIDGTTGELVVERGNSKSGFPAFMEVYREMDTDKGTFTVKSVHSRYEPIEPILIANAVDGAGSPYANLQALWDALTSYFDATV